MRENNIKILLQLKNNSALGKTDVCCVCNKNTLSLIRVLYKEGFILGFYFKSNKNLIVKLNNQFNSFIGLKIFSKPTKNFYLGFNSISRIKNKKTVYFISTSSGILTLAGCIKSRSGGNLLFTC